MSYPIPAISTCFVCVFASFILLSVISLTRSTVIEAVICFFSVFSVVGLAGFHSYLVSTELTTNEDVSATPI